MARKLLGQILKERKIVQEGQVQQALAKQRSQGGLIGQILIELGHIDGNQLAIALGIQAGMEVVDLDEEPPQKDALGKVDPSLAALFRMIPHRLEGNTLIVVVADPSNTSVLDDIRFNTNLEVEAAIASPEAIDRVLKQVYGNVEESMKKGMASMKDALPAPTDGPLDLEDKESMARAAPVVRLLNYIFFQAIRDQASDIHLEPFEDDFRVRYRVDGVLYDLEAPPQHLAVALISRVKVMSNLDIAETRVPQDGRIELMIGGRPVDIRVSTLPTMFGESCVMRILDRSVVSLDIGQIGLDDQEMSTVLKLVDKPNGIILVTGPTGSGKTTTLYSALNHANDVGVKIITVEDPIEYDIDGIVQIQIQEEIGVTYAKVLRTILRQDPDKILVGEIRDAETAQIAIEASLTGHVVFSTLHTNDAPAAITRLLDIGIDPFLITATLEAIVAQRLVRRICLECKTPYKPTAEILDKLDLTLEDVGNRTFYYGKGCETCNFSGYKGRRGLFEIMVLNEALKQLILDGSSTDQLRRAAQEGGMRTLRESGRLAVFDGSTTIEEVIKETQH
ncbi:MAG: ATPase, T2SS/T4P/T4SS family [Planctomycetota bacterium]